jgi:hypothetical protein
MNVSKAIELAIAETIRKYAELGDSVTIRAWQSLEADGSWKENPDRTFPMIDVRCSPPKTDDNQSSRQVECAILCGTKTDDDKSHAFISDMYGAVQGVCDKLFKQFRGGTFTGAGNEEIEYFISRVEAEAGADKFIFGGFTFGDGLSPSDDNGVNMIGVLMIVHFGNNDF